MLKGWLLAHHQVRRHKPRNSLLFSSPQQLGEGGLPFFVTVMRQGLQICRSTEALDFAWLIGLERVMGIEPTWPAWKAGALPLSYTRTGKKGNHRPRVVNRPFKGPRRRFLLRYCDPHQTD